MPHRILIVVFLMTVYGCAAVIGSKTSFTPWEGEQLYQGNGGAVVTDNGVEFWSQGEPGKPFKIIGLITQSKSDDSVNKFLFDDFNKNQIIEIVKREGGDGVVVVSKDRFISGYTTQAPINQYGSTTTSAQYKEASVLAVFKYDQSPIVMDAGGLLMRCQSTDPRDHRSCDAYLSGFLRGYMIRDFEQEEMGRKSICYPEKTIPKATQLRKVYIDHLTRNPEKKGSELAVAVFGAYIRYYKCPANP